jgi:hypothetical protein
MVKWLVNNELENNSKEVVVARSRYYNDIFSSELRKSMKNLVRIVDVSAEIRTDYFPNTSLRQPVRNTNEQISFMNTQATEHCQIPG